MNKINSGTISDLRRFSTHAVLFLIAVLAMTINILLHPFPVIWKSIPGFLLLVFIEIEIFIFLAGLIFRDVKTAITRREITRIILSRLALFLIVCFIAAFLLMMAYLSLRGLIKGYDVPGVLLDFFRNDFKSWLKATLAGLSAGVVIFLFILWQDGLKREQKLKEENLIFQNETLKNQVNPHFLFNSLNTISSLVKSQPEKAEQFINDLSSVYRYILENAFKEQVPLQQELDFIKGYFDLYRVRDEGKMTLTIDAMDSSRYHVLPVSLQILVENAIKHNIATRENQLNISVHFEDQNIVVRNNLQRKATNVRSTAVGLKNLSERIRLSTGKPMIIEETDSYFTVKVPLI